MKFYNYILTYCSGESSYLLMMRRPALVMAPLGIVNFIELMFAAMFIVLLLWSLANYLHFSFQHLYLDREGEKMWGFICLKHFIICRKKFIFFLFLFFFFIISNEETCSIYHFLEGGMQSSEASHWGLRTSEAHAGLSSSSPWVEDHQSCLL